MKPDSWDKLGETFSNAVLEVTDYDQHNVIKKTLRKLGGKKKIAADFGCGIGASTRVLAPYVKSVVGYDFSKPLLETAKKKTRHQNATYEFLDLRKTWRHQKQFELSLCVNALISDDAALRTQMFSNIVRATKPGGILVFVVPSLEASLRTYQLLANSGSLESKLRKTAITAANKLATEEIKSLAEGIVSVGNVPTKHFMEDELKDLFFSARLTAVDVSRVSYPWDTIIDDVPGDIKELPPWDWIATARKPR